MVSKVDAKAVKGVKSGNVGRRKCLRSQNALHYATESNCIPGMCGHEPDVHSHGTVAARAC